MRNFKALLMVLAAATLCTTAGLAQGKSHAGFDRLKSLAGDWEGKNAKGEPASVSYKLVSGGTALLETLDTGKGMDMVTVYHLDGDRLMMTHYCAIDNQPRMRAEPPSADGKSLAFSFMDATNLSTPSGGHMHKLTVTFADADHFSQRWTWREAGKDTQDGFQFQRRK